MLPPLTNPPAIPPVTLPSPYVTRPEMRTLQSSGPALASQSLLAADTLPPMFPRMRVPALPLLTNLPAIPHETLPRPNVTQPETANLQPSGPASSSLQSWLVADALPPMFSRTRRGMLPPLNCRSTVPLVLPSLLEVAGDTLPFVAPHTHRVMLAVPDTVNHPSDHTPSDSPVTSPCRDGSSPETPSLHLSASACLVEESDALMFVSPLSLAMSDSLPSGLKNGGTVRHLFDNSYSLFFGCSKIWPILSLSIPIIQCGIMHKAVEAAACVPRFLWAPLFSVLM